jgi:hypothetical protein
MFYSAFTDTQRTWFLVSELAHTTEPPHTGHWPLFLEHDKLSALKMSI